MTQKSSFTLVIPCYNEEKAISSFLIEMKQFIMLFKAAYAETELRVRLVDNNSSDRSSQMLAGGDLDPVIKVLECRIQGYGAALKHGFQSEDSEFYAFADLDNTYPLNDFIPMLKLLKFQKADLVYGTRLHAGSEISWMRRLGNRLYVGLVQLIFSVSLSDSCSGMRIFSDRVKKDVLLLSRDDLSFSIELTATALKKGWAFTEFPIQYRHRLGESKLSVFFDGFKFLAVLLRVRLLG